MSVFVDSLRRCNAGDVESGMRPLWEAAQDAVAVPVVDIQQIYDYVMLPVLAASTAGKDIETIQSQTGAMSEAWKAINDGAPLRPLFQKMWLTWRDGPGRVTENTILWQHSVNERVSADVVLPSPWVGDIARTVKGELFDVWQRALFLQLGEKGERVSAHVNIGTDNTTEERARFMGMKDVVFVTVQAALYHMAWKREIRLVEHLPSRQQRRYAEQKGLHPPAPYHVLDISPWVRKVNAAVAREIGAHASGEQRQHVVRGHQKTFTPSGPIGGCKLCPSTGHPDYPAWNKFPHVGTFWVDSFVAGNPEKGAVDKSYRVLAPGVGLPEEREQP